MLFWARRVGFAILPMNSLACDPFLEKGIHLRKAAWAELVPKRALSVHGAPTIRKPWKIHSRGYSFQRVHTIFSKFHFFFRFFKGGMLFGSHLLSTQRGGAFLIWARLCRAQAQAPRSGGASAF